MYPTPCLVFSNSPLISLNPPFSSQGLWRIQCNVQEHADGGMKATYQVLPSALPTTLPTGAKERVWYVAAEAIEWEFTPGYVGIVPVCVQVDFTP